MVISPSGVGYYSYEDHPFGERRRNEVHYSSRKPDDASLLPRIRAEILSELQNPETLLEYELVDDLE
jgi:hypothetical protein